VIGEAGSVNEAVAGIGHLRPDVVLLDVHLPDGGGAEVLRRVHTTQPDVVFLALPVSDAAEDVIAVIRAGARGYVTKTISGRELVDAVLRVHAGIRCSRRGWRVSCSTPSRSAPVPPRCGTLSWTCSPRASATCSGCSPADTLKEIAAELFISIKTVETHVSSVLRKTQLSNRYELSRWASDRRLV